MINRFTPSSNNHNRRRSGGGEAIDLHITFCTAAHFFTKFVIWVDRLLQFNLFFVFVFQTCLTFVLYTPTITTTTRHHHQKTTTPTDMIHQIDLSFTPAAACWIHPHNAAKGIIFTIRWAQAGERGRSRWWWRRTEKEKKYREWKDAEH
jgi:hypothetical protein